jgi:hypothetical protein
MSLSFSIYKTGIIVLTQQVAVKVSELLHVKQHSAWHKGCHKAPYIFLFPQQGHCFQDANVAQSPLIHYNENEKS